MICQIFLFQVRSGKRRPSQHFSKYATKFSGSEQLLSSSEEHCNVIKESSHKQSIATTATIVMVGSFLTDFTAYTSKIYIFCIHTNNKR